MDVMPADEKNSPVYNALIATAAFVIVMAGVYAARLIVIPFLLAIFIAVILSAILSWLKQHHFKTGFAIFIMLLLMGVLGTGMVLVVGASVNELVRKLPQINLAVTQQEKAISVWLETSGFLIDRNEQEQKRESQSLEISVPGLVPTPEIEEDSATNGPTSQLTPEKAETTPIDAPTDQQKNDKSTPVEESTTEESTALHQAARDAATAAVLPSAEVAEPAAAMLAAAGDQTVTDQSATKEIVTEATAIGATAIGATRVEEGTPGEMVESTDAPVFTPGPRFEVLYPNYMFGPQKHIIELVPQSQEQAIGRGERSLLGAFSPVEIFRSFLESLMGVFNYALVVFLMLFFLLLEWNRFGEKLEKLPGDTQSYVEQVSEILASIRQYMLIKTMVSLLTGLLIAIWLMLLGTNYAPLWGTVAFIFNYIPTIGSIIAGVVPTLFVLVDQGPFEAAMVAIAFLVVNFLVGNVLEPRIMGDGLGLSTFVVFLSLVFWGFLLGPVGMLLAVPLTMAIKIALGRDERTKWIAMVLGATAAPLQK